MVSTKALAFLVALLAGGCVAQQYGGDYDPYEYGGYDGGNFYEDGLGDDGAAGGAFTDEDLYADEYGYYGDEDEQYYDYYGYYADGSGGYDDYYAEDDWDGEEECRVDATSGKPVLSNRTASCDIKINGVDKQTENLPGGLDGTYKLVGCHNGKPMYQRSKSPAGEERTLWYSHGFGDWDVTKGLQPNDDDVLMYGGEMEHASTPLFVSNWYLGSDLKFANPPEGSDFVPISIKVACADGKKYDPEKYNAQTAAVRQPVLTPDELEQRYMQLYTQYARADPSPGVNFTFVVLMVMLGLTIVLAIPYFLMRKQKGPGTKNLGSSFAQMLQHSKKKSSGHLN